MNLENTSEAENTLNWKNSYWNVNPDSKINKQNHEKISAYNGFSPIHLAALFGITQSVQKQHAKYISPIFISDITSDGKRHARAHFCPPV